MEAARAEVETVNQWRDTYMGKVNELTDMVERLRIERTAWQATAGSRETEVRKLRATLDRVIAERDEARRDRASLRNRCTLLSEGNRRITARLSDALAERDRARGLAVRAGAFDDLPRLWDLGSDELGGPGLDEDAVSCPPAWSEPSVWGYPRVVGPTAENLAADSPVERDEDPCPHESLEPVGYGSRQCTVCGIHLPPAGITR
jgi:hypothetical protein